MSFRPDGLRCLSTGDMEEKMAYWVKNFPIVPVITLLLLAVLLAACRVVAEEPTQTAYPAPVARQATAQSTRPPVTKPSGQATAQPTPLPATKKPVQATAVPATAGRTPRPTAAPSLSPTPAPTRGDVAFSLTLLYTGEVHGEVRPCG